MLLKKCTLVSPLTFEAVFANMPRLEETGVLTRHHVTGGAEIRLPPHSLWCLYSTKFARVPHAGTKKPDQLRSGSGFKSYPTG